MQYITKLYVPILLTSNGGVEEWRVGSKLGLSKSLHVTEVYLKGLPSGWFATEWGGSR